MDNFEALANKSGSLESHNKEHIVSKHRTPVLFLIISVQNPETQESVSRLQREEFALEVSEDSLSRDKNSEIFSQL